MKNRINLTLLLLSVLIIIAGCSNKLQKQPASAEPEQPVETVVAPIVESPAAFFETQEGEGGLEITKYVGTAENVVIPKLIHGKQVTTISENAFRGANLISITIPNSVKSIKDTSFSGNPDLEEIIVDPANDFFSSVDGILFNKEKSWIFRYPVNKNGEKYSIPESVTKIKVLAFHACRNLTSVNIPVGVTNIEFSAFDDTKLNTIVIPNSVTEIGGHAFRGTELTSVMIPASVQNIGEAAFATRRTLMEITVDESNSAFTSENGILFSKDKTQIRCYPNGRKETAYTIPEGIKIVSCWAFNEASNLELVTIPSTVEDIAYCAFSNLRKLTVHFLSHASNANIEGDGVFWGIPKENITFVGQAGSKAQEFAEREGIKFIEE